MSSVRLLTQGQEGSKRWEESKEELIKIKKLNR